jgi:peptidoglycan-N-acetylglucosamine deacetylase
MLGTVVAVSAQSGTATATARVALMVRAATTARVALTFDDLPAHGPVPPGLTRVDIADRIVEALRSRT